MHAVRCAHVRQRQACNPAASRHCRSWRYQCSRRPQRKAPRPCGPTGTASQARARRTHPAMRDHTAAAALRTHLQGAASKRGMAWPASCVFGACVSSAGGNLLQIVDATTQPLWSTAQVSCDDNPLPTGARQHTRDAVHQPALLACLEAQCRRVGEAGSGDQRSPCHRAARYDAGSPCHRLCASGASKFVTTSSLRGNVIGCCTDPLRGEGSALGASQRC
jgi:hypothetical protein